MTIVNNQLELYEEMKLFNESMLEKVSELTDDMNEKDEKVEFLE